MNLFNKSLLAGAMLVASSASYASQFYVDLGSVGLGTSDGITGPKNQLGFDYNSNTTITLGDASLDVGDAIVTTGGIDTTDLTTITNTLGANHFSGLIPSGDSEGYTTDPLGASTLQWGLSFSFNLVGEIAATDGTSVSEVSYSSGLIEIFLITYNGANGIASAVNVFDLTVQGSGVDNNSNFLVNGIVSFNGNEPNAYRNMFHMVGNTCSGASDFYALATCTPPVKIDFILDQNLDNVVATVNGDGTATIAGDHNGSLKFNVPEPSTLLLLGSSLFAFGATRRKKA